MLEQKQSKTQKNLGNFTFLGLIVLATVITVIGKVNYIGLLSNVLSFVTGNVKAIPESGSESLLTVFITLLAILIINLVANLIVGYTTVLIVGAPKTALGEAHDKLLAHGSSVLLLIILGEEVIARLIPGLLNHLLPGSLMLYILLIIGNIIWALIHLSNYKTFERNPIRIIPQFVSGIFFMYVFVRYGFFYAFILHVFFDALLFSSNKQLKITALDAALFLYWLFVGFVAFVLIVIRGLHFDILAPWFMTQNEIRPIHGLGIGDFIILDAALTACIWLITIVLCMDRSIMHAPKTEKSGRFTTMVGIILACVFVVGMYLFFNWVLSFVIASAVLRALVIAIVNIALDKTVSGSGFANSLVKNIPGTFFTIAVVTTFGFSQAVLIFLIAYVIGFVPNALRQQEPEEEIEPINLENSLENSK